MRAHVLDMEFIGERELDDLDAAVCEHVADPRTVVMPHLIFLAWGRKPAID